MYSAPLLGGADALAHGAGSGPRRVRGANPAAEASSLTLMVRRRPRRAAHGGMSAGQIVREEAKAAGEVAMKVSAAARNLNLFKREVYLSDSRTLEHGSIKTWTFIISFVLSSIVILGYYGSQSQIIQKTVYKPTLDNYLGYLSAGENPSCPCTKVPTFSGGVVKLSVPESANLTTNACSTLKQLKNYHIQNFPNCAPTDNTCFSIQQYMFVSGKLCSDYERALEIAFTQASNAVFPPTLLDPDAFAATALQTAGNTLMQGLADGESVLQALQMPAQEPPKIGADLSYGALKRKPEGCSCNASYISSMPPSQAYWACEFRAPFDTRQTWGDAWWGCGMESNTISFPLALLLNESFYAAQNISSSLAAQLMNFSGAANITELSTVGNLMTDGIAAIFPLNLTSGEFDSYNLKPGVLTASYAPYFGSCAPATCILSYEASPTLVQAVTTALGVLSGLNTALRMAVDMGYDYFCEQRCAARMDARRRRKAAGAHLPGDHTDGGDGDGDSSDSDADWDDAAVDETPEVVAAKVGLTSPLPLSPHAGQGGAHTPFGPTVVAAAAAAAGGAAAPGGEGLPHLHSSASGNSLAGNGAFSPTGPMRAQRGSLAASSANRLASLSTGPSRGVGGLSSPLASTGAVASPSAGVDASVPAAGAGPALPTSAAPFGAPQLWRPT